MKYINFSLWGNDSMYVDGMVENIKLRDIYYEDWYIVIYHQNVLQKYIDIYSEYKNVICVESSNIGVPNTFWRFLPYSDEYDCVIIRDADSRLSARESVAVMEWLDSDKNIHIMRDHPHHGSDFMMAGMWGYKKIENIKDDIIKFLITNPFQWVSDGYYLRYIYNKYCDDSICNDSSRIDLKNSKPFTYKMNDDRHFVGEKFHGNNVRYEHYFEWVDKKEL